MRSLCSPIGFAASLTIIVALSGCQFDLKEIKTSNTSTPSTLPTGITYETQSIEEKDFQIVSIDPKLFNLEIVQNEESPVSNSIKDIHDQEKSIVTFNGSFFTEKYLPTGLLISAGKTLHEYQKGQLINGIFLLKKNHQPELIPASDQLPANLDFAIQNGPILLNEHSEIMVDDRFGKSASRTAIGLDKDNHIIVILLRQSLLNRDNTLTLLQFARVLANSDYFRKIGLHSVLNLDGGTSTGLAIGDEYFPELAKVQNIIITKPQS